MSDFMTDRRRKDRNGRVLCRMPNCKNRIAPMVNGMRRRFCDACLRGSMIDDNKAAAEANIYKDRPRTGRRPK